MQHVLQDGMAGSVTQQIKALTQSVPITATGQFTQGLQDTIDLV